MIPIEVLKARQHGDAFVAVQEFAVDVVRVGVVEHRVGDEQVHTTEPVDQLDQALQPDPRVLVDVDVEVPFDGGDGGSCPAVSVCGVDLRAAAG